MPESSLDTEKNATADISVLPLAVSSKIDPPGHDQQASSTIEKASQDAKVDLSEAAMTRKILLLTMFTLVQFLDAFNSSALFPAIPVIASQLSFDSYETIWVISAYQLTFAAFLLVSGRISDVFTPKPAFVIGCLALGITHLIAGFVRQKIVLLVLRALGGIGAALTIPSALSLIIQLFPGSKHQARAIALFGSAGAIGNIVGILIGAVLVQYASWSWIFWFVAILAISIATLSFFLIPNAPRDTEKNTKFDFPGLGLLTVAMILFIFAVTSGSPKGWGTAYVLAPLLISILLFVLFFVWEARIPPDDAVLPTRMWKWRNFSVLASLALLPGLWWSTVNINIVSWWEGVFGWTIINTAVHLLPTSISGFLVAQICGYLPTYFAPKHIILFGIAITIVATILLPFGDSPDTYWPFSFPAFILGTVGQIIVYSNSSIAIFSYTPPSAAGTVGAVFTCALQLGSAVGLAAVASITTSVDSKTPPMSPPVAEFQSHMDQITKEMWKAAFQGRAASFWFVLGLLVVQLVCVIVFFKIDPPEVVDQGEGEKKVDVEAPPEKQ